MTASDALARLIDQRAREIISEALKGAIGGIVRGGRVSAGLLSGTPPTAVQRAITNVGASLTQAEAGAPATPASGYGTYYVGTDGRAYFKNDAGTVFDLAAGAATLDELSDVVIASPALSDRLRYDGSTWRNSAKRWEPLTDASGALITQADGDVTMSEV